MCGGVSFNVTAEMLEVLMREQKNACVISGMTFRIPTPAETRSYKGWDTWVASLPDNEQLRVPELVPLLGGPDYPHNGWVWGNLAFVHGVFDKLIRKLHGIARFKRRTDHAHTVSPKVPTAEELDNALKRMQLEKQLKSHEPKVDVEEE
jgi:hypothetical protein